jgi:hypothetical protein
MNFLRDVFNSITGPSSIHNSYGVDAYGVDAYGVDAYGVDTNGVGIPKIVGPNESCIIRKFKPNFLEQGKTLHREQTRRSEALRVNIRDMNENIEGFGTMTVNKNSAQTTDTTTLSNDFDKKIDRYNTEYPLFIDETRSAMKLNDRNKNIHDNSILFTNKDNNFYDITYEKEGCYKSSGASGLVPQSGLNNVNVQTCKMRASDLGYSGFAIRKGPRGNPGCYLSNDIPGAKSGGIATRPVTSYSFKKSSSANKGGLLQNGQLGIYTNNIDNKLVTDLTGIEGCDAKSSDFLINENSVVATFGGNCTK